MKVYLDTSVILRVVLEQPGAFPTTSGWDVIVCSEILRVEVMRVFDRLRLSGAMTDADRAHSLSLFSRMSASFEFIPIGPAIMTRAASPFSAPVGTLDAIHLATALIWVEEMGEALTFLTHDAELALAARASGLEVLTGR